MILKDLNHIFEMKPSEFKIFHSAETAENCQKALTFQTIRYIDSRSGQNHDCVKISHLHL